MSSLTAQTVPLVAGKALSHSTEISNLITRLDDLQNSSSTTIELIRLGAASVPLLGDALLYGKPRSISQPRCCLVDALATLGANDVLLEYLTETKPIHDPEIRFAEDAVMNAAARALKLDFSAEAYCTLFELAQTRSLPGVLEALAMYRRTESIACFIQAMENDLSRSTAIQALEDFGQRAKPYLLPRALMPQPGPPERESNSSRHRRRACLHLLTRLQLNTQEQELLLPLLLDQDPEIVLSECTIILKSANKNWYAAAARRLRAIRPRVDWFLRDELDELVGRFEEEERTSI